MSTIKVNTLTNLAATSTVNIADINKATSSTYVPAGTGAVATTVQAKLREQISVLDFIPTALHASIANGTNTTALHTYIQAAVNYAAQAGSSSSVVRFPKGRYLTSAMLRLDRGHAGITLVGDGGQDHGESVIYGPHAGDAILSLQGALNCTIRNIMLDGGTGATFPKTALLVGREGSGSAGWHVFDNLRTGGRQSVAAYYNVASEGNTHRDCFFYVAAGATATKVAYLASGDSGGLSPVTPLTGSTLLGLDFNNCHFYTEVMTAGVSCIYIDGSVSLGSLAFRGGYLVQANGHFVSIRSGVVDGMDTVGPITFDGVGGERPGGVGQALSGFNLIGAAGFGYPTLHGLNINKCTFLMHSPAYYIQQDNVVILQGATIDSYGVELTQAGNPVETVVSVLPSLIGPQRYTTAIAVNGECLNCLINDGTGLRKEGANAATLESGWSQSFSVGNGYGVVGYYKDIAGNVTLTGAPNGSVIGTIFFLPVGYRPLVGFQQTVATNTSGLAGQGDSILNIDATTGAVAIITGGGVAPVYLCGISFRAA